MWDLEPPAMAPMKGSSNILETEFLHEGILKRSFFMKGSCLTLQRMRQTPKHRCSNRQLLDPKHRCLNRKLLDQVRSELQQRRGGATSEGNKGKGGMDDEVMTASEEATRGRKDLGVEWDRMVCLGFMSLRLFRV